VNLLLVLNSTDLAYHRQISALSNFANVIVSTAPLGTSIELHVLMKRHAIDAIATTRLSFMRRCDTTLEGTDADNYGYVVRSPYSAGKPVLMLPPIHYVHSVPEGNFLIGRYLRKLYKPDSFLMLPKLRWQSASGPHEDTVAAAAYALFSAAARIISIDIETKRDPLLITSVSYTAWLGGVDAVTLVIPITAQNVDWAFDWIGRINACPAPKLFQNGQYDNAWFLRFNVPVHNWLFDTLNAMHCYFPELPKDLAFLSMFFLRGVRFWKNEATANALEYNAKDTHTTLFVWLAMMAEFPQYAHENYVQEFKLVFPCLHSGLEGIAQDKEERAKLRAIEVQKQEAAISELRHLTGVPEFNPNSSQQVLSLMRALGFREARSTEKTEMQRFAEAHVMYEYVATLLRKARKAGKAISTYYDMSLCAGRLLYKLDPAGTDTGRMASQASPFWTGTQIQNIPAYCKGMFVPDAGYHMAEVDNAQSESRCTAYISQDARLIDTVENSPDFHCTNGSLFFGIPFELLFDVATGKVLRKDIRTVAKRVNHGANYNMGPDVLVDTMGTSAVLEAGRLLALPGAWRPRKIAEYLLECFHRAYPQIAGRMYPETLKEVAMTGRLLGATGWTRRTFLTGKNKLQVNSLVAHPPQSLSVMLVNRAYYSVWRDLQLASGSKRLRLKAQIHDSLFFQYPIGGEAVIADVSRLMQIPCTVNGRTMVIPNDPKFGAERWSDLKD
jgi:hypothetical protein